MYMKEYKAKIYVAFHEGVSVPKFGALIPISINRKDGIHIAEKESYSELRTHYWVWKNDLAMPQEYVGFFQFRRYLDFSRKPMLRKSEKKGTLPYRIYKSPDLSQYTQEHAMKIVSGFDVVAPVLEYTGISVWNRYGMYPFQRLDDLKLMKEIVLEKYPEYETAMNTYLHGCGEYYGNIYIMRRKYFDQYCQWLFDILECFDERVCDPLPRTAGYLAERLFGIWFTYQKQQGLKCGELPRVHFSMYDDKTHHLSRQRVVNYVLRPGGKIRSIVKKTMIRLRG